MIVSNSIPDPFLDGSEDSLRKKIIALSVNQTSKVQLVKMLKAITVQSEQAKLF